MSFKLAKNLESLATLVGGMTGIRARFLLQASTMHLGTFEARQVLLEGVVDSGAGGGGYRSNGGYWPAGGKSAAGGYGPAVGYGPLRQARDKDDAPALALPYASPGGNVGAVTGSGRSAAPFVGHIVRGSVKSFNSDKMWGFVKASNFDDDCLFSFKNNPHLNGYVIRPDMPVTFTVEPSKSRAGAFEAVQVTFTVEPPPGDL